MKIERATTKDFEELKRLWSIVFQEDPEFLEHFFAKRFKAEHIVVARKDGEIVSALHALPATYSQNNTEKQCSFIVGAATYASFRKQGIMSKLLAYTKETTPHPITLFPAVRPFYEENGYITTSSMEEHRIPQRPVDRKSSSDIHEANLPPSALDAIYREATKKDGSLSRDQLAWEFLISGYELCSVQGAYAFTKDGKAIEAIATDEEAARKLISLLQSKQIERMQVVPHSPFTSLFEAPFLQIPMGMSTDESMRGVYIAEQY